MVRILAEKSFETVYVAPGNLTKNERLKDESKLVGFLQDQTRSRHQSMEIIFESMDAAF